MARFLMMTGPYPGHVAPCLLIARKLVERNHQLVWITGCRYQEEVESTGARFYPLPEEIDPKGMEIYEFYPELKRLKGLAQIKWWIKHVFLDGALREIEALNAVLAHFPADVLVGDTVTLGPYFRSEMGGPPSACLSVLPKCTPSCDTAPYGMGLLPGTGMLARTRNRLLNLFTQHMLLRDVNRYANRVRRQLGLEPLDGPLLSTMPRKISLTMQVSTNAFEYPRSDQLEHVHLIGPIIPQPDNTFEPPPWWADLKTAKTVVLVNQGTIANVLEDLIVPTINALKDQQMLVVAVPVKEGDLRALPDHVRAAPFIPFDHLLPHIDVMVTNGGYGGTQWALAHGIPLVVAGETEDKKEVAARVEWSGAGINLRKQRPSPEDIRQAVREVLTNPVYRENAKRIQSDFAQYDAPRQAVELLEALAGQDMG
jgi:UDP:flavonoid glycosyltransferase YjiC (YdhE family)